MDKYIACVASYPARERFLAKTIESIYHQFDEIYVYLNDYAEVPEFLLKDKIFPIRSQDNAGNLKALGKFFMADKVEGYYFSIDDDITYPKDYRGYLGHMIDHHYREAVIGVHGTDYPRHPIKSYYKEQGRRIYYCYHGKSDTSSVHMLGTGTMAFHTDTLKFNWREFEDQKNMLDPQMCRHLHKLKIPAISLVRAGGWIKEQPKSQETAIWKSVQRDDTKQTAIINTIPKLKQFKAKNVDKSRLGGASIEYGLMLWMIRNLKKGANIVELGSGYASKEIAKGFDLTSVEHNFRYLKSHDNVIHAPLKDNWYDTSKMENLKKGVDAYLIDGPPASQSDRRKLLENLDLFNKKAVFILDDVNRSDERELAEELASILGRNLTIHRGKEKDFATI